MADKHRADAFQRLKLTKIHLTPRLLERCSRHITQQFDSLWAPVEELARRLHHLPTSLVRFVTHTPRGHIVITPGAPGYEAGVHLLRGRKLEAVAFVSLTDLVEDPLHALHVVGHLLDHLLGCRGAPAGRWLSDGHGLNPSWAEIGQRIPSLYDLGYAVDKIAAAGPRQYFARSVAWYICDRRQLNVADPQIERLLRRTIFDEDFCRRTLPPGLK